MLPFRVQGCRFRKSHVHVVKFQLLEPGICRDMSGTSDDYDNHSTTEKGASSLLSVPLARNSKTRQHRDNVGGLIIRIGFWGVIGHRIGFWGLLHYKHNKEPPK